MAIIPLRDKFFNRHFARFSSFPARIQTSPDPFGRAKHVARRPDFCYNDTGKHRAGDAALESCPREAEGFHRQNAGKGSLPAFCLLFHKKGAIDHGEDL